MAAPRAVRQALRGEGDDLARHREFIGVRTPGDLLDGAPVAVASGEILEGIHAGGVVAQDRLDEAAALEEDVPFQRREQPQTRHAIADGDLIGGLPAVFTAQDLVRVGAARFELGFEPFQDGGPARPLVVDLLEEADDERVGQAREGVGDPVDVGLEVAGRPGGRLRALVPAPEHLTGEAPEVLDQDQAEHRGDGPKLADGQGGDRLKRLDIAGDPRLVQAAVGVGDQGEGQGIHARIAVEGAVVELGEFGIVAARQVVPDLSQDFLDDVEVVGEPFRVEFPPARRIGVVEDAAVGLDEDLPVLGEPSQQRAPRAGAVIHEAGRGQVAGVGLQMIQPEQLAADRVVANGVKLRGGGGAGDRRGRGGEFGDGCAHPNS